MRWEADENTHIGIDFLASVAFRHIEEIGKRARGNTPKDIKVAVRWFKPTRNETDLKPDFYLRETAEWLVFPHELDALTPEETREARPEIHRIVYEAKTA